MATQHHPTQPAHQLHNQQLDFGDLEAGAMAGIFMDQAWSQQREKRDRLLAVLLSCGRSWVATQLFAARQHIPKQFAKADKYQVVIFIIHPI